MKRKSITSVYPDEYYNIGTLKRVFVETHGFQMSCNSKRNPQGKLFDFAVFKSSFGTSYEFIQNPKNRRYVFFTKKIGKEFGFE